MKLSFCRETIYGLGKEAIFWMPIAIGLATNNPTISTVGELSHAALNLYAAYKNKNKIGRSLSITNAVISLITPFTYHPSLTPRLSATVKACCALAIGGNNVVRGGIEIAAATKRAALESLARIRGQENSETGSLYGRVFGNTLRLALGIYRVYTGSNMVMNSYTHLFLQSDNLQHVPKMDPKHNNGELQLKPGTRTANRSPKVDPKYAKEEFHSHSKSTEVTESYNCFPKSGKYHPNDVAFYDKIASSPDVTTVSSLKYVSDKRCVGTLYLRAEDVNYLHSKDGYLRTEDTNPIGEISSIVGEKLINDGRVWYRTVEKVGDICKRIDEVQKSGGKIKRLILVGHGNSQEILLSQKNSNTGDIFKRFFGSQRGFSSFDQNNVQFQSDDFVKDFFGINDLFGVRGSGNRLRSILDEPEAVGMDEYIVDQSTRFSKKGCLNNLEPKADIVLMSCSTGKGNDNIADAIARQAPGHRVVAPNANLKLPDVKGKKIGRKLKFYFENSKGNDMTYTALPKTT